MAKQVSDIQEGCELHGKEYNQEYKLPNILKMSLASTEWKAQIKKKMREEHSKELKTLMLKVSKVIRLSASK